MSEIKDELQETYESLIAYSKGLDEVNSYLTEIHKQSDLLNDIIKDNELEDLFNEFTETVGKLMSVFERFKASGAEIDIVMRTITTMSNKIDQATKRYTQTRDDELYEKLNTIVDMWEENREYKNSVEARLQRIEEKLINLENGGPDKV